MAGKVLLAQGVKRRKAILTFLRAYDKKNGFAPTIQEIADAVDLVSPNATRNHLRKLEEDGYIKMQPRIARAITLIKPGPDEIERDRKRAEKAALKADSEQVPA